MSYAYNGTGEALAALLPKIPMGTADVVWAPGSDFARGCVQALADAGRHDIKLVSIGISNENLRLMTAYPDIWLACAAVDPALIGIVNMRILAAKLALEDTPEFFSFDARILEASVLDSSATMGNIAAMYPGWALNTGLFDNYPWMEELKTAVGKYQRIPAQAEQ
jgi:simple sugar transport system substrate-binding protein